MPASVSKTCLVRFDNNKYSVNAMAIGRPVEIYAYADRIMIRQDGRIVGEHICSAGKTLTAIREGKLREMKKIDYGNIAACRACVLRPRCTKDFRAVSRLEDEDALDRMAARLKARPELLDRRRELVEHPFGSIKQWMNQGAFLMRGLEKVRGEFSLTALAYNLRRALNILSMDKLMAAVAA